VKNWIIGLAVISGSTSAALGQTFLGKASYYGYGGRTASGARVGKLTAAHRTLPFGSKVRVTNLANARSVVVTINDRGPFVRGRVIDVSVHAADSLGFRHAGVARVKVERLSASASNP
jgi:rare lipoprotein A